MQTERWAGYGRVKVSPKKVQRVKLVVSFICLFEVVSLVAVF